MKFQLQQMLKQGNGNIVNISSINALGGTVSQTESVIPLGRIEDPNDIADSVIWLCSDQSSYITGHVMVIDGGESAKG